MYDEDDNIDESYQIKIANSCNNFIVECNLNTTIKTKSYDSLTLTTLNTINLTNQQKESIYNITEYNMKSLYDSSGWGWKPIEKRNELYHPLSKFIIVSHNELIVGFAMFRFEYDDEEEPEHIVSYCYEFQILDSYKRQGIGSQILITLLTISNHFKMWKILLTCFKANTSAIAFYKHEGFDIDCISPSSSGNPSESYEILSNKPHLR